MKLLHSRRFFAGLAAALSGGIGLFTLVSWLLDLWELVAMGTDYIPMAPITALLFVCMAAALAGRLWLAGRRSLAWATQAGMGLALAVAAAELVRSAWPVALPWDYWGFGIETGFGVVQIGRMAPLTAVVFILTTLGFFGAGPAFATRRWVRYPAAVAALAGFLTCSLVLLAYVAGTPLGYIQGSVPMAWLTALAFMIINAGILAENEAGGLGRGWWSGAEHTAKIGPVALSFRLMLVWVMLAVSAVSAFVAFYLLRQERAVVRHVVEEQLEAVVNLKVGQIQLWRDERLSDARLVASMPGLAGWIGTLPPLGAEADQVRGDLADYLITLRRLYGYRQIVLWDRNLAPVFVNGEDPAEGLCLPDNLRQELRRANEPLLKDLHRVGEGRVHMGLIIPLRTRDANQFAGAVQLVVDPSVALYPLVAGWPSSSESGECVLVRPDGADVLFLNELRHRAGSALKLRMPLDSPTLMVARAIRSKASGLLEGTDYRGVPSVGVVRRVSGTPWYIVAKMDQSEAYASIRDELITVITGVLLVAGIVGLFLRTIWQEKQKELTYQQLHQERKTRVTSERLAHVMNNAGEVILLFDENMRIVEANQRALEVYGHTPEQMTLLTAKDLRSAESAPRTEADFAQALSRPDLTFESIHVRRDGTTFPVEVSARAVEIGGHRHVLSIIRDISLRRLQDEEIARLSRLYYVISQINKTLLRVKTREQLFAEVCKVLVDIGGFRMAWVGCHDPATALVQPVAAAGDEQGCLDDLRISVDPLVPEGRGPTGTAYREGRVVVCNDYLSNPATLPWRERALRRGFRSSIALPLRSGDQSVALLSVYSAEKDFFSPREVELLEETVENMVFALEVFAQEARRKAVEADQRKLSRIIEQAPLSIAITDLQGMIEYVNPTFLRVTGYAEAEVLGQNPRVLKSGLTPQAVYTDMWNTLARGEVWSGDLSNKKKNGEIYHERAVIAPVADDTGRVTHYVALKEDVTRTKQTEDELRLSTERFRALFETNLDGVMITLPSGEIIAANPAACAILGRPESKLIGLGRRDVIDAADTRLAPLLEERQRTGKARGILTMVRGDGTRFEADISSAVFGSGSEQRNGLFIRDITDQIRAQEQMRRFNEELEAKVSLRTEEIALANNQMQALLQSVPDLVLRVDRQGTVLNYQPAKGATPLASIAREEVAETRIGTAGALRALVDAVGSKVLAGNTSVVEEHELPAATGTVAVELRASPVSEHDFVVFARDVTARKLFEAEMAAMLEREHQISEMKTRFISVTSHEFRTPMAAALGSVELLTNHHDRLLPARRFELLARVSQALGRMTEMLDEILLLNRMDANRVEVRLASVDLLLFVRNLVEEIRLGDKAGHVIELECIGETAGFVTDTNLLHHILGNILSNAVRYSPAGSHIAVRLAVEGGTMRFVVEDQGIGIPEADLKRIFEPFERGSNVGNIKGTGLGLNIVKRMAEMLQGEITVRSAPTGSCFTVTIHSQPTKPAPT